MKLDRPESMLFALLRMALWGSPADHSLFAAADEADWESCMCLAVRQGVQTVAFDGMVALPLGLQPPRLLKLTWATNTAAIEQRHARYLHTASRLVQFYEAHGIRVMLMKGLGLAEDYPIPAHRESGDLDIWLFGQYAEGNRLMTQQDICVDLHSPKHACFFFGGVPVENHRTFLNVTQYQIDRNLEKVLHRSLAEGRCSSLSLPEEASVLLPPPLFSAVFLARHLCVHFVSGIVLRHLCDWARFLSVHRGEFDTEEWTAAFREVGLLPVVQAFTRLAVEYLGLSREDVSFLPLQPSAWEEPLLDDILHPSFPLLPEQRTLCSVVAFKWRRLLATRWKYTLVHREAFGRKLAASVLRNVLHPYHIMELE